MKRHDFQVNIETNRETGEILAVYLKIREGKAAKVREFAGGNAYANYARNGLLLGIEVLGPCEIAVLDSITARETKAREFVRKSIPVRMLAS